MKHPNPRVYNITICDLDDGNISIYGHCSGKPPDDKQDWSTATRVAEALRELLYDTEIIELLAGPDAVVKPCSPDDNLAMMKAAILQTKQ